MWKSILNKKNLIIFGVFTIFVFSQFKFISIYVASLTTVFSITLLISLYFSQKDSNEKDYRIQTGLALMLISITVIWLVDADKNDLFKTAPEVKEYMNNFFLVFGAGAGANIFTAGIMNSMRQK